MAEHQQNTQKEAILLYFGFSIIMIALGAGDSLRGTLAPVFCEHFGLDAVGFSGIISSSYVGNFLFLWLGGALMSRTSCKRTIACCLLLWLSAMAAMAVFDGYQCLAVGMAVMMGASTMLNTCMNLTVPQLWPDSSGLRVNLLFFVQGIGTSLCQYLVGNHIASYAQWKILAICFAAYGLLTAPLLVIPRYPDAKQEDKSGNCPVSLYRDGRFYGFILIFSFYFIAEHGMLNWYVNGAVAMDWKTQGEAANVTAAFFGAIMLGRLLLSPLPDRIGTFRALRVCAAGAAILYIGGVVLGKTGAFCLVLCGFWAAILYPTLVMSIALVWGRQKAGSIGGKILSIASLADILFNACFGAIIEATGYRMAFWILPGGMAACAVAITLVFRNYAYSATGASAPQSMDTTGEKK